MFTSIDKALTAAVFGILSILNLTMGTTLFGLTEVQVQGFLTVIGPLLVYFIRNKQAE